MGKHIDNLNRLRELRYTKESNYRNNMAMFSSVMDDNNRRLNEQHYEISMGQLDREIRAAEKLAQQEQIDEITQGVLKNLSKEGSKVAKDIAAEMQKALKSIKL